MTDNPWVTKLGGGKKVSLKGLARDNGKKPGKLAGLNKPKPLPKKQSKRDFYHNGVLFWNAKILGEITKGYRDGVSRPFGSVDVSNGDKTFTLHNRYGSWMADIRAGEVMAESARVAKALGINMSQAEMSRALATRFEAELKEQGVPTVHQQRVRVEEAAKIARARTAAKQARSKNNTENPWIKALST